MDLHFVPSGRLTLTELKALFYSNLNGTEDSGELHGIWKHCLEFILQSHPQKILTQPDFIPDMAFQVKFTEAIQRLKNGEPVQYISGVCWFMGSLFQVNPSVLIPRPETEELVLTALKLMKQGTRVLDIGTGSGCIAISLQKLVPEAKITAIDISAGALKTAQLNAQAILDTDPVEWLERDILKMQHTLDWPQTYDLIVSNPPYIPNSEMDLLEEKVRRYEPPEALFCREDPALFYRAIADFALNHLNQGGYLLFEVHALYGNLIAGLLKERNFEEVELIRDIHGKGRILKAKR